MDEFFKALRYFLTRDIVYLIGGGSVVGSLLYRFDNVPKSNDHLLLFILLGGIGYVIAYALQDGLSLTPFITTVPPKHLEGIKKWLYERFTQESWEDISPQVEFEQGRDAIKKEFDIARFERIVTHKQIGTTIGPCFLVCSAIFFWKWVLDNPKEQFDIVVAISALFLGLLLVGLGWVKLAQEAKFLERFWVKSHDA